MCIDLVTDAEDMSGAKAQSLFLPDAREALRSVAPYLVSISPTSDFLDRWAARFGTNSGILMLSTASTDALHAHLRRTFVVADEEGQEYFFRYYDPRVLRPFMPTCTSTQLEEFFGPVREFAVESDDGLSLHRYRMERGSLAHTSHRLTLERARSMAP